MQRTLFAVMVMLGLVGCTPTVYSPEAVNLSTAAESLASAVAPLPTDDLPSVNAYNLTGRILDNQPLAYNSDCYDQAYDFRKNVLQSVTQPVAAQDAVWKAGLPTIAVCKLQPGVLTAVAPAAPAADPQRYYVDGTAMPSSSGARPSPPVAGSWSATNAAGRNSLAAVAQANPLLTSEPAEKQQTVEDVTAAVAQYASAVKALTDAKSNDDINAGLDGVATSLNSLAKIGNKDNDISAATGLLGHIAKGVVEQQKYDALVRSARAFNTGWSMIAPSLKTTLRLRASYNILSMASENGIYALRAQAILNDAKMYGSPVERYTLFKELNGDVDVSGKALLKARTDPAKALDDFSKANTDLQAALADPKRQIGAVFKQIMDLHKLVGAL